MHVNEKLATAKVCSPWRIRKIESSSRSFFKRLPMRAFLVLLFLLSFAVRGNGRVGNMGGLNVCRFLGTKLP